MASDDAASEIYLTTSCIACFVMQRILKFVYWVSWHAMMWRAMSAMPHAQGTSNLELQQFFNEALVSSGASVFVGRCLHSSTSQLNLSRLSSLTLHEPPSVSHKRRL